MEEEKKIKILAVYIMAILLLVTCSITGKAMYDVGVQDGLTLTETPTIRNTWSILNTNTTVYNATWYFISAFGNTSIDVLPTLRNDSWFIIGGYHYVQGNNSNSFCNFTLTIPKIQNQNNITIERISVLTNEYSTDRFMKIYNIIGKTSVPIELNITNVCTIAIWGYGENQEVIFGSTYTRIPEFKLSNFVLFNK